MDWGFNPQPKGRSRLEVKDTHDKAEDSALDVWRNACGERDKQRCRCCGRKVEKSIAATPKQRQTHHLTRRAKFKALLTDVRNGLTLCKKCHERVTGRVNDKLFVTQKAGDMFVHEGISLLNGDNPVTFEEMAK